MHPVTDNCRKSDVLVRHFYGYGVNRDLSEGTGTFLPVVLNPKLVRVKRQIE
jgi:hypothetical protein